MCTHCLPTFIPNSKNIIKYLSTHVGAQVDPTPMTSTLHGLFFDGESTIPFSTCTCTSHKGSTLNGHTYYPATSLTTTISDSSDVIRLLCKNPSPFVRLQHTICHLHKFCLLLHWYVLRPTLGDQHIHPTYSHTTGNTILQSTHPKLLGSLASNGA